MPVFLIAYDLNEEKNSAEGYEELWNELERLGAHRTQYSLWLVNMQGAASQVLTYFKKFVDENDSLWVTRIRPNEYARLKAKKGTQDWLDQNPPA